MVGEVGYLGQRLVANEVRDLGDHPRVPTLLDAVRELGDDDRRLPTTEFFDVGAGAHDDATSARPVGITDPAAADDDRAGRKVRALDVFHQILDVRLGSVDQLHDRVDRFA